MNFEGHFAGMVVDCDIWVGGAVVGFFLCSGAGVFGSLGL